MTITLCDFYHLQELFMSVNFLTKSITAFITLLLVFMSVFIVWAWQEMDKPYQIRQHYHQIKYDLDSKLALSLEEYLGSGSANKLGEAEQQLTTIKSTVIPWLEQQQWQQFVEQLLILEKTYKKHVQLEN